MLVCFGATFLLLVACLLLGPTRAFIPTASNVVRAVPNAGQSHARKPPPRGAPILSVYNSNEHDEEWLQRELAALERNLHEHDDAANKKTRNNRATRAVGPGRAGGRTRRAKSNDSPTSEKWSNNWVIIPVLAIAVLLKTLSGGADTTAAVTSSPSIYYYKSDYYESRVYTGNGNMERKFKSSFESNVPSLMPGRTLMPQQSSSERPLLKEGSDYASSGDIPMTKGELDAVLIKVQQAMFSDWY